MAFVPEATWPYPALYVIIQGKLNQEWPTATSFDPCNWNWSLLKVGNGISCQNFIFHWRCRSLQVERSAISFHCKIFCNRFFYINSKLVLQELMIFWNVISNVEKGRVWKKTKRTITEFKGHRDGSRSAPPRSRKLQFLLDLKCQMKDIGSKVMYCATIDVKIFQFT